MFKSIMAAALGLLVSGGVMAAESGAPAESNAPAAPVTGTFVTVPEVPCPVGWSVEPNPSMDNSLSYLSEDGSLAISVTAIRPGENRSLEAGNYARVAAEQMGCSIPVRSNIIDGAWSFKCEDREVEGVVYGGDGELVLLGISGRSAENEKQLLDFVKFLAFQAER